LYLHAITGPKARYDLQFLDGKLSIYDTLVNQLIDYQKLINKDGIVRWRIKPYNGYRYFDQKDIDTSLIRRKIAETPIETLQKRNNVEATIFQVGYHYPNDKSRYRGLVKHQMWANIRSFWVNFVRITNFNERKRLKPSFFQNTQPVERCMLYIYILCDQLMGLYPNRSVSFQKIKYSSI